ncbi:glycosyltransferase [Yoonia sp. SS1-5]|uniref:Glycosyltransferase n=1 Tax=Yoonia rhodophyticola TaxID=3137370 RepID=A0AAN0NIE8_9RHOB
MRVLHVSPAFYPATRWGGPIQSTKAICDGVAARNDVQLRMLTTDAASPKWRDRLTPVPLPYPVRYAYRLAGHSIAPGLLARLPQAIAWADVVHLTATYSFPTLPTLLLARLMGKPLVWSPRGALQATTDWVDAPNRWAKRAFANLAQMVRADQVVLHATSEAEARQSVPHLRGVASTVIPNCVDLPQEVTPIIPKTGLRLLYLGRLHPKKGLDLLLDAMAALPPTTTLDIYGTGDPAYMQHLRDRAATDCGRIWLHGHVDGPQKAAAFAAADLLVLPSHSENFGIVVAEALAHARPVLTTTGTPWARLAHRGCGACIDLRQTDLATAITDLSGMDLRDMGLKGREWMAAEFGPAQMVDAFYRLYRDLLSGAGRPVPA